MRAALTREQPVIRDFYDMHYARKNDVIDINNENYVNLVKLKLDIHKTSPIDLSSKKMSESEQQVATELLPTLRAKEQNDFNLEETFSMLQNFVRSQLDID